MWKKLTDDGPKDQPETRALAALVSGHPGTLALTEGKVEQEPPAVRTRIAQPQTQANGVVQVSIQVNINCPPADVEDLAERLRRMLGEITGGRDRPR